MNQKNLVAADDICMYHQVEYTFISSLQDAGLVHLKVVDKVTYLPENELQKLERMIMHHELEINIAGIEAINHLLERVEQMQEEMRVLRNRVVM